MSNVSGDERSFSSGNTGEVEVHQEVNDDQQHQHNTTSAPNNSAPSNSKKPPPKKKRNLPGTPDPNADIVALSPTALMATNRFVCEICNKGFQRDQNLQLHRRGHNLPWKLRQRSSTEVKKRVYVCPEPSCVHHNPARALGDLTGIKKHYSRKHGEKKWKCDKCSKRYAVQSDWKAHQKTCGTREYKCDCGTIFSRRDSFITHRAFCDALTEENNRVNQGLTSSMQPNMQNHLTDLMPALSPDLGPSPFKPTSIGPMFSTTSGSLFSGPRPISPSSSSALQLSPNACSTAFNYLLDSKNLGPMISGLAQMSATALLQKAAQMGATASNSINSPMMQKSFVTSMAGPDHVSSMNKLPFSGADPSSYDHFHHPHRDQPDMAGNSGGGPFTNQLFHKSPQEISQLFDATNAAGSAITDMGMFSQIFLASDQNPGLMMKNNAEGENSGGSSLIIHGRDVGEGNPMGPNMATVHDFLGVGEPQPQRLEIEAMNQQGVSVMNQFEHHLPRGDSALDKSIWDV
ncbi:protein indeterminate-domain 12-like [Prosopis cineraria]|uniref:protein indeterminate-domain 12-like n=1 Tax=Prosopis cineraria TaxID=364024 RepID=UPI00240FD43B|nr:protein indeterminate-domain 12-like [Prosopis cineraria]